MNNQDLLIVDDENQVIKSLKRELRFEKYHIHSANNGKQGLKVLENQDIGVVLSDHMMPEMDGITFLEHVKENYPTVVRILMTAHGSLKNAMKAVNRSKIFSYVTKPWATDTIKGTVASAFTYHNLTRENLRLHKLTEKQNQELKHINLNLEGLVSKRTKQLEEAVKEGVLMLAVAAEAKDNNTGEHVNRIQNITTSICSALKLKPIEIESIGFASIMHDVGKIHIPDHILQKKGALTDEEYEIMKTHTIAGEKILGNKTFYKTARLIARSHHERWDGTGYPDGLKGASIPFPARIVSVADVFDALTHQRSYKSAWSLEKTIKELKVCSGTMFDPEIVDIFLGLIKNTKNNFQ